MDKPDQLRELFRMQRALNERIRAFTDGVSEAESAKWISQNESALKCVVERMVR